MKMRIMNTQKLNLLCNDVAKTIRFGFVFFILFYYFNGSAASHLWARLEFHSFTSIHLWRSFKPYALFGLN